MCEVGVEVLAEGVCQGLQSVKIMNLALSPELQRYIKVSRNGGTPAVPVGRQVSPAVPSRPQVSPGVPDGFLMYLHHF